MFDNIVAKIKAFAKCAFIINLVLTGVTFLLLLNNTNETTALINHSAFIALGIGVVWAYGFSLLCYGFAVLVENSYKDKPAKSNTQSDDSVSENLYKKGLITKEEFDEISKRKAGDTNEQN